MSQIYLLGYEDTLGLGRLNHRPYLAFDSEVGGWDNLHSQGVWASAVPDLTQLETKPAEPITSPLSIRCEVGSWDNLMKSKLETKPAEPMPHQEQFYYQTKWGDDQ